MPHFLKRYFLLPLLAVLAYSLPGCQNQGSVDVTFCVTSPPPHDTQHDEIFIAGNFNDWQPDDERYKMKNLGGGVFELNASFPTELGQLEYKYTRGDWITCEMAANGHQSKNRLLPFKGKKLETADTIASWLIELPAHSANKNVRVVHDLFHIPQLDRQRTVWVYLPSDYEDDTDKRYPVVYMHDGQNLFDDRLATFGEWGVDESMRAIEKKYGYSAIIVGIEHGEKSRIDEYSPYHHEKHGGGEGKRYLDFIVTTLKPYIDKNYRTIPDRKHTAIGGSSMGGLISFCAGIYYPETFSKLLVFSPSFWFSDEVYKEAQKLVNGPEMRIYMLAGGEEVSMVIHGVEKMDQLLSKDMRYKTGENLKVKITKKGKHHEAFWREYYPYAYAWLFSLE